MFLAMEASIFAFLYFLVDDGCIIDVNFDDFVYEPPSGYQKIMFEKSLLWWYSFFKGKLYLATWFWGKGRIVQFLYNVDHMMMA